jgi:hypothetical protein
MALFIDGPPATIEDLRKYESSILETAGTEDIDLTEKLAVGWRDVGIQVEAFLRREAFGRIPGACDSLENLVVTLALLRTHTLATLHLVYSDAATRHTSGRYREKAERYERGASEALEGLVETGAGVVSAPIRRAQKAVAQLGSGFLSQSGYYLRSALVNHNGVEGEASIPQYIDNPGGSGSITVRQEQHGTAYTGWNVYLGLSLDSEFRQNDQPIQRGGEWLQETEPRSSGALPPTGQTPERYVQRRRILRRG